MLRRKSSNFNRTIGFTASYEDDSLMRQMQRKAEHQRFKQTEKQVEQLQRELNTCVLGISNETEKNNVLQQLITVLKGEMNTIESIQQVEAYESHAHYEKQVKKVEYDIKQILHKHNEEVAKINALKELANSSRSERVVFSNLFKKIQKEIRQCQQTYTQGLIRNQLYLAQQQAQAHRSCSSTQWAASLEEIPDEQDLSPPFSTPLKEGSKKCNSRHPSKLVLSTSTPQEAEYSLEDDIDEKQNQIDRLMAQTEYSSVETLLSSYAGVGEENERLSERVQHIDEQIEAKEQEIARLLEAQKCSTVLEDRGGSLHQEKSVQAESEPQVIALLEQICSILHINSTDCRRGNEETLREVFCAIEQKVMKFTRAPLRINKRLSMAVEQSKMKEKGVEQILERMDHAGECQRIFDRSAFQMEYYKEVNKSKNKPRNKKTP